MSLSILPSEMIGEILSKIPPCFYPAISKISLIFYKEANKKIKKIVSINDFREACLKGDYLSVGEAMKKNSIIQVTMCNKKYDCSILDGHQRFMIYQAGIEGACEGGYEQLITFLLEKTKSNPGYYQSGVFNFYLNAACKGGHIDIVNWMISLGSREWGFGLRGAITGGHMNLVKDMLKRMKDERQTNLGLRWGFYGACETGNATLIEFFINEYNENSCKNPSFFNHGFEGACKASNKELMKRMIELSAESFMTRIHSEDTCYTCDRNIKEHF